MVSSHTHITLIVSMVSLVALAQYCPTAAIGAPAQPTLTGVATATLDVPHHLAPYGLAYAKQSNTAFVALSSANDSFLGVLDTSALKPRLVHTVPFPSGFDVEGVTVSSDGQNVYGAGKEGAIIFDAARAAAGDSDSIVGTLNGTSKYGSEAVGVTLTSDDKYAFVSQEYGPQRGLTSGNLEVFQLNKTANGEIHGSLINDLSLGYAVVGATLSPDGKYVYVISEATVFTSTSAGLLSMIEVASLMNGTPSVSNVFAGCDPTRAIVSCDGRTVWVAARFSNSILAFDTSKILNSDASGNSEALIATVAVGTEPNDLIFAKGETRIVVVDSKRDPNRPKNGTAGLSVVDVQAAFAGKPALLGNVPVNATSFPREISASPDGKTLLVTLAEASRILAVDVDTLP